MSGIYSITLLVAATAYIRADTEAEAIEIARGMEQDGLEVRDAGGDIEISGLQYDDPDLPDVSFSPAMTVQKLDDEAIASIECVHEIEDEDEDHEDELQEASEDAAMAAKGITPAAFAADLPTTFIFTYGDGSLGDIRDKAAERYATLETIRAVPGNRRAIIAEVQLLDEAAGHYKVIRCHARH